MTCGNAVFAHSKINLLILILAFYMTKCFHMVNDKHFRNQTSRETSGNSSLCKKVWGDRGRHPPRPRFKKKKRRKGEKRHLRSVYTNRTWGFPVRAQNVLVSKGFYKFVLWSLTIISDKPVVVVVVCLFVFIIFSFSCNWSHWKTGTITSLSVLDVLWFAILHLALNKSDRTLSSLHTQYHITVN